MHIIKTDIKKKVPVFIYTFLTFYQDRKRRTLFLQRINVYLFSVPVMTESSLSRIVIQNTLEYATERVSSACAGDNWSIDILPSFL